MPTAIRSWSRFTFAQPFCFRFFSVPWNALPDDLWWPLTSRTSASTSYIETTGGWKLHRWKIHDELTSCMGWDSRCLLIDANSTCVVHDDVYITLRIAIQLHPFPARCDWTTNSIKIITSPQQHACIERSNDFLIQWGHSFDCTFILNYVNNY